MLHGERADNSRLNTVSGVNAISRSLGAWRHAVSSQRVLEAVRMADEAELHLAGLHPDSRLESVSTWAVEACLRLGRSGEARERLEAVERKFGASATTRHLSARLHYFLNDHEACAATCADALILSGGVRTAKYRTICRTMADSLCLMGQHHRARDILLQTFVHQTQFSNDDIRALRQTAVDVSGLEIFSSFFSGRFGPRTASSRAILYHYSLACRDLGLYERAIATIRRRMLNGVDALAFGASGSRPQNQSVWQMDASVALNDLKRGMDQADTPFFLISGTLLGCVRDGAIIGHDKDIDVGVMEDDKLDKSRVHDALAKLGVFSVKPYQNPALLRLQHANGVMIDLFWHRREDGLIIHEGMKSKWWNSDFQLEQVDFLGNEYLKPVNHDRYLCENYGDWRTPDSEFETFVDTPNMIITNTHEILWYFYCKILEYYNKGKVSQFLKLINGLLVLQPADEAVRALAYKIPQSPAT